MEGEGPPGAGCDRETRRDVEAWLFETLCAFAFPREIFGEKKAVVRKGPAPRRGDAKWHCQHRLKKGPNSSV